MLTAGILVMVAAIVVGVLALVLAALRSPAARLARRRARTAMAGEEPQEAPPRSDVPTDEPRWILALVVFSGAGLVLGLLMVMIASIP